MSRKHKKKKSKAKDIMEYLLGVVCLLVIPIFPLVYGFGTVICTPDNVEVYDIVIQDAWFRAAWGRYDRTTAFVRSTEGTMYWIEPKYMNPWYNEYFTEGTKLEISAFYTDTLFHVPKDKETGEKTNWSIVGAKCGDKVLFDLENSSNDLKADRNFWLVVGFALSVPCWGILLLFALYEILKLILFIVKLAKPQSVPPAAKKEKRKR